MPDLHAEITAIGKNIERVQRALTEALPSIGASEAGDLAMLAYGLRARSDELNRIASDHMVALATNVEG